VDEAVDVDAADRRAAIDEDALIGAREACGDRGHAAADIKTGRESVGVVIAQGRTQGDPTIESANTNRQASIIHLILARVDHVPKAAFFEWIEGPGDGLLDRQRELTVPEIRIGRLLVTRF
jgi:hypothetical protein